MPLSPVHARLHEHLHTEKHQEQNKLGMGHTALSLRYFRTVPCKTKTNTETEIKWPQKNISYIYTLSRVYLGLELVGGCLDRHPRAVEAKWKQGILALQALVLHAELALSVRFI